MDFTIKEESEIKQEQGDIEPSFRIIELEHIFKPEPIEDEFKDSCNTLNYVNIKLEPIELKEDSIRPNNNDKKFEPIYIDHNYARAYQPFSDRTGKHKPIGLSEIKKKFKKKIKRKSQPPVPFEPQTCSICGEKFALRTPFERHLLRHGTTKSLFECDLCGKKCKLMKNLQSHIMTVHVHGAPIAKVQCKVCNKWYRRDYLPIHISRHNTEYQQPSLECTTCGKYFHIPANLIAHMRTHSKKKAPCNICGKSFVVPEPLRVHKRTHTGEKPYLCWICGLRYRSKSTFNTHLTVHWTGTNFHCKLCDSKFKNPNGLDNHIRKVHGTKISKAKPQAKSPAKHVEEIKEPATVIKQESHPNDLKLKIYVNVRTYSK